MAISVTSVEVLDNPTSFTNPLQFEIQYECLYQLNNGEYQMCFICLLGEVIYCPLTEQFPQVLLAEQCPNVLLDFDRATTQVYCLFFPARGLKLVT
jgi:ASF1 like histone chaperone